MGSFFKTFFAALFALVVFTLLAFFFLVVFIGGLTSKEKPSVMARSVLVLDLGQTYTEQQKIDPLSVLGDDEKNTPGLYDIIRLLHKAKSDKNISGIYIIANSNPNGFAASEEIRHALVDFKAGGKFIIAHGDVISQKAYSIANVADKIYVSPQGFVEWAGYSVDYAFLKGTLDKLEIHPQIFYAGKFKSATEPLRSDRMTPANQLQTSVWLNDLYNDFLLRTAAARKSDTATLHQLANSGAIQQAQDAVTYNLIDGLKYDDEIKDEIKAKLGFGKYDKINFVSINTYRASGNFAQGGSDKMALIYAEGDIIDGTSSQGSIGSETYRNLIRKARLDKNIKAIIFRINSGGGSSMASENIWRELELAKKEKPVIVSFGDVAASGGYYIACAADSIFALPTTITGSIGVFGIIPDMGDFFRNKLGVTFDGVKTGPYANTGVPYRALTENEKKMIQSQVDITYALFKQRVAEGRKRDTAYIDSIAQGRVWTGLRAKEIGLIDRFGGIEDAIRCAAKMAKLTDFQVKEYPEPVNMFERFFGKKDPLNYSDRLKQELGEDNYRIYMEIKRVREMSNSIQARLPFQFFINK